MNFSNCAVNLGFYNFQKTSATVWNSFLAGKTVLKQRQKCQKLFQLSYQNAWQLELVVVCCWCTLRNDFPFWNLSVRSVVVWYKLFKHKKTNLRRSFFTWLCLWLGFYTYTNMSQDKNLGRRIGVMAGVKITFFHPLTLYGPPIRLGVLTL